MLAVQAVFALPRQVHLAVLVLYLHRRHKRGMLALQAVFALSPQVYPAAFVLYHHLALHRHAQCKRTGRLAVFALSLQDPMLWGMLAVLAVFTLRRQVPRSVLVVVALARQVPCQRT